MLDRIKEPIEYQSWLQTEPDAVSLHLAALIADAKATAPVDTSRVVARVGVDWPTLALAIGIYGAFASLTGSITICPGGWCFPGGGDRMSARLAAA